MNRPVNQNAPVRENKEIFIKAPPENVWAVLSDIDNWPAWQSEVTAAKLEGELKESTGFKWETGGIKLTSELHTVEPFKSIGWTGKAIGTFAIHNWRLESKDEGTQVYVEESLEGFLPRFFKRMFKKTLEKGMKKNLAELKSQCEN